MCYFIQILKQGFVHFRSYKSEPTKHIFLKAPFSGHFYLTWSNWLRLWRITKYHKLKCAHIFFLYVCCIVSVSEDFWAKWRCVSDRKNKVLMWWRFVSNIEHHCDLWHLHVLHCTVNMVDKSFTDTINYSSCCCHGSSFWGDSSNPDDEADCERFDGQDFETSCRKL